MSFYIWRKTFIKVDELSRNIQSKVYNIAKNGYIFLAVLEGLVTEALIHRIVVVEEKFDAILFVFQVDSKRLELQLAVTIRTAAKIHFWMRLIVERNWQISVEWTRHVIGYHP